jgi:hypothetical protein
MSWLGSIFAARRRIGKKFSLAVYVFVSFLFGVGVRSLCGLFVIKWFCAAWGLQRCFHGPFMVVLDLDCNGLRRDGVNSRARDNVRNSGGGTKERMRLVKCYWSLKSLKGYHIVLLSLLLLSGDRRRRERGMTLCCIGFVTV